MSSNTPSSLGSSAPKATWYLPFLILISGLGGLLAGVDFGIIAGALLYVDKTIPMTEMQQGLMVSIYFVGGVLAALFAGGLADLIGRKKTMIAAGLIFIISILLIYTSSGFSTLLVGRTLMGLSGGLICVIVPLFMAECLPSEIRGRGTSAFQFMLVVGLPIATLVAKYYTGIHDATVEAAAGNTDLIFKADDAAWRNMFLVAAIPGVLFTFGALFLKESPRWLFRRKREDEALAVLRLSRSEEKAALEMREMGEHGGESKDAEKSGKTKANDSLFQRKYIVPFILACIILACTQATGINTIISYAAKILQGAGLNESEATSKLVIITSINVLFTFVGAMLVDRLGRKILLSVGTAGIVACLLAAGGLYQQFESKRVDVAEQVVAGISKDGKNLKVSLDDAAFSGLLGNVSGQLNVLYKYVAADGKEERGIATAFSNADKPEARTLTIAPPVEKKWVEVDGKRVEKSTVKEVGKLEIVRAQYGPIADGNTGLWITIILCALMAFFAVGPGVCVWLALTELMPTRIRSVGMGVAMVLNSGVQFLSAFLFPTVVGHYGFSAMFFVWAGFTIIYFITAAFFLPETKGKTLEEIEDYFEGNTKSKA